jgi:hypothetical protein
MTKKEAKKFAKTKHKGLPEKVKEEKECDYDEKKDTRGDYAKVNLIKNKLRSMGAKNPIVMVASEQVGPALPGENRPGTPKAPGGRPHLPGEKETPLPKKSGTRLQLASYDVKGNIISERENDEPGERDSNPEVKAHNRKVGYKPRPRRPRMEDDPRYGTPRDKSGNWKY